MKITTEGIIMSKIVNVSNSTRNEMDRIHRLALDRYYNGKVELSDKVANVKMLGNLVEEISEYMANNDVVHERVDALGDMIVFMVDGLTKLGLYDSLFEAEQKHFKFSDIVGIAVGYALDDDELSDDDVAQLYMDMVHIALAKIDELKYADWLVLSEVYKEISSRVQDPEQLARGRKAGEKWQKYKGQDRTTLYTANFNNCLKFR